MPDHDYLTECFLQILKEIQKDLETPVEWTILIRKETVQIVAVNGDRRF